MTSPFGWRTHPVTGGRKFHSGVDLSMAQGTPVRSTAPGEVVRVRLDVRKPSGLAVSVEHPGGWSTFYAHLSAVFVVPGQTIPRGAVLGLSGATGRVTGPHLHYGVYVHGKAVDPLRFRPPGGLVS